MSINGISYKGRDKTEVLREVWGYTSFNENQEEAIDLLLEGKTDILYLARTGAGKSIVYQLPALIKEGTAIIVSPLLSLMDDQIIDLQSLGLRAETVNSTIGVKKKREVYKKIADGSLDLLYCAPETLLNEDFLSYLKKHLKVSFISFDESHCISQYGSDFRPKYKKCSTLRDVFKCPVIALTATADVATVKDIKETLSFGNSLFGFKEFVQNFDRPSITYNILIKDTKSPLTQLTNIVNEQYFNATGIIYCSSRKQCEDLSYYLYTKGYKAGCYHAGMAKKKKAQTLQDWLDNKLNIVCCTTAFGLGINKPDVRYVINYSIPSSIEDYAQMVGRASRDGLPSNAYLLYSGKDVSSVRFILRESTTSVVALTHKNKKLDDMVLLAKSTKCIRKQLLKYFNQDYDKDDCDSCSNCVKSVEI